MSVLNPLQESRDGLDGLRAGDRGSGMVVGDVWTRWQQQASDEASKPTLPVKMDEIHYANKVESFMSTDRSNAAQVVI